MDFDMDAAQELDQLHRDRALAARKQFLLLQQQDTGEYARCVDCDNEIPQARRAAVPHTKRCVECEADAEGVR